MNSSHAETRSHRTKRRPSPALVIALLALFVALGGTALAAKVIITSPSQLGKGVVTNAKVKKATLQANRLSTKARKSLQGQPGLPGPSGPSGPAGEQGPPGASAPPLEAVTAVAAAPASPSHNCEASPAIGQFCARVDLGGAYNFWRNLGAGFQPAGFFKDGSGLVHIQGSVTFDSLRRRRRQHCSTTRHDLRSADRLPTGCDAYFRCLRRSELRLQLRQGADRWPSGSEERRARLERPPPARRDLLPPVGR